MGNLTTTTSIFNVLWLIRITHLVSIVFGTLKIIDKFITKKDDKPSIYQEFLGTISALFLMISFSYT